MGIFIAVLAMSGPASGGLLVNGGFENPPLASGTYSYRATIPGWGRVPFLFAEGFAEIWPAVAADGSNFADIGNSATMGIEQVFLVPEPGLESVRWAAAGSSLLVQGTYRMELLRQQPDGSFLPVVQSDHTVFGGDTAFPWQHQSLDLTGHGAGTYKLRFHQGFWLAEVMR